jgi:hypothetical protein
VPETDAIFAHVHHARGESAAHPHTLRVSIDTQAKVTVGEFSRGGERRAAEAVRAADHDMHPSAVLVPFGVPEVSRGATPVHQPWVLFGHSRETSDFLADGLERWWAERKAAHPGVTRLHVELDNGPGGGQLADAVADAGDGVRRPAPGDGRAGVPAAVPQPVQPDRAVLGILERHWNGALLSSVADVPRWAGSMTWRGVRPIIRETTAVYERGVPLTKAAFQPIPARLLRSTTPPKWSVTIRPSEPGG